MGLFNIFNASEQRSPKLSKDGAPEAPNRNEREHCYEARDIFYGCLDRHNIVDSIKDEKLAAEKCGREGRVFEKNCASTWVGARCYEDVKHFKQRRVMEIRKRETIAKVEAEGGQIYPGISTPRPGESPR